MMAQLLPYPPAGNYNLPSSHWFRNGIDWAECTCRERPRWVQLIETQQGRGWCVERQLTRPPPPSLRKQTSCCPVWQHVDSGQKQNTTFHLCRKCLWVSLAWCWFLEKTGNKHQAFLSLKELNNCYPFTWCLLQEQLRSVGLSGKERGTLQDTTGTRRRGGSGGLQGGSNPRGALKSGKNLDKHRWRWKAIPDGKIQHGLRIKWDTSQKSFRKIPATRKAHSQWKVWLLLLLLVLVRLLPFQFWWHFYCFWKRQWMKRTSLGDSKEAHFWLSSWEGCRIKGWQFSSEQEEQECIRAVSVSTVHQNCLCSKGTMEKVTLRHLS